MEAVRQPRCAVDVEVPADRVGTICLQGVERIDSVSFGLTHLLSVLILNVAENDNVLVRRLIKEQRGLGKEGVEPSSCLVNSLGDELCRELFVEKLLVLKRIVMLCERHCAGVEPAVNNLRYTVHFFSAVRAGDHYIIDKRTVKLNLPLVSVHLLAVFLNNILIVRAHLL